MFLAELVDEVVEVGQFAERAGRLAVAERLVAAHPLAAVPGEVGPQRPQVVVERGHLRGEVGVAERLRHEAGELLALLRGERGHQPLGGSRLAGQLVDELVDVLRVAGEQVPVLGHELVEVLLRVLAPRVLVEQLVEVAQHVLEPLVRRLLLGARRARLHPLQRIPHPAEALIEHVAAQPVENVAVDPLGLRRRPAVLGQLLDRRRRRPRQRVELSLGEPGVVAVDLGERLLLRRQRLVELGLRAGDGAVEPAATGDLATHAHGPGAQVVEPLPVQVPVLVGQPPAQHLAQRVAQAVPGEDLLAERVERLPHVVGRRQRVRPALPGPVPVPPVPVPSRTGHQRSRRRRRGSPGSWGSSGDAFEP